MAQKERTLPILSFESARDWEAWLAAEPETSKGVWLKLAKKVSGRASVSRQEAIDAALCHGWIDGQIDSFDDQAWLVRFTPRKAASRWSKINRDKATALIAEGRMRAAGLRQIELAKADGRWDAAYPSQGQAGAPEDLLRALDENAPAKRLFAELDSANRYAILYRIHHAKSPEARTQKIEALVAMLGRGETIHPRKSGRAVKPP